MLSRETTSTALAFAAARMQAFQHKRPDEENAQQGTQGEHAYRDIQPRAAQSGNGRKRRADGKARHEEIACGNLGCKKEERNNCPRFPKMVQDEFVHGIGF